MSTKQLQNKYRKVEIERNRINKSGAKRLSGTTRGVAPACECTCLSRRKLMGQNYSLGGHFSTVMPPCVVREGKGGKKREPISNKALELQTNEL